MPSATLGVWGQFLGSIRTSTWSARAKPQSAPSLFQSSLFSRDCFCLPPPLLTDRKIPYTRSSPPQGVTANLFPASDILAVTAIHRARRQRLTFIVRIPVIILTMAEEAVMGQMTQACLNNQKLSLLLEQEVQK